MTRVGVGVILVAMAIQGLTPDCGNLASPWLLRIATAWSEGTMADDGAAPSRSVPLPDDPGDPGAILGTSAAKSVLRIRLGDDGPILGAVIPAGLIGTPPRPSRRSLRLPGPVVRGASGLLASLCRFLC